MATADQAILDAEDKKRYGRRAASVRPGDVVEFMTPRDTEVCIMSTVINVRATETMFDIVLVCSPRTGRVWCSTDPKSSFRVLRVVTRQDGAQK